MNVLRIKASVKCGCGKTVAVGSVFCPFCRGEVLKKNDLIYKKEENKYQKEMSGKSKKKKKK